MKLQVRNLGRINEAELDIRPLTVFVGKNNTNKTWVAYSLWGILRNLTWRRAGIESIRTMGSSLMKLRPDPVRAQIDAVIAEEIKRMQPHRARGGDLVELETSRNFFLRDVKEPVEFVLDPDHIGTVLRYDGIAPKAEVRLKIAPDEFRKQDATIMLGISYVDGDLRIRWTSDKKDAEVSQSVMHGEEPMRERATDWLRAFAQRFSSLATLLLLPTEREMLVSTYNELESIEREREMVLMAPTTAFVKYLNSAARQWSRNAPTVMPDVLKLLNERLLGGTVEFVKTAFKPQLVFIPKDGPPLPIHAASAMVRSLAGLALYIQHGARAGDILIIDEPEMNAHPEVQIATTELLALLVNHGIHVIITTHSPYIVDHLNNLMAAKKLSPDKQRGLASKFALGTADTFLESESVAAYWFDENEPNGSVEVKSIVDRDRGDKHSLIEWDTFNKTSIDSANLYGSILESLDEE